MSLRERQRAAKVQLLEDEEEDWDESKAEPYILEPMTDTETKLMIRKRWKSIAAAVILFVLGTFFLLLGIYSIYIGDWWYGIPCFLVTFMCGTPGGKIGLLNIQECP